MEKNVVIPTTPDIENIIEKIEQIINRLSTILSRVIEEKLGRYESEKEAFYLMVMIIRDIEGFLLMAKEDLCLLAPAESLARPVFEIAIRLLWILAPNDPFEREARWIAHLRNEENDREKAMKFKQEIGMLPYEDKILNDIRTFRRELSILLEQKGYTPHGKLLNMHDMLTSLGEKKLYLIYMALCQSTHGTHIATWRYRRNLGVFELSGEFIKQSDWALCFKTIWYSLLISGKRFLEVVGENDLEWVVEEDIMNIEDTLNKILL